MSEENKAVETMKVRLLKRGHPNHTIFVLGGTGSGKTTLIANLLNRFQRFILFDSRNEYDATFFSGEITIVSTTDELFEALNDGKMRIIIKLSMDVNQEQMADDCLTAIYAFQQANKDNADLPDVWISIDELNLFAETNSWPKPLQEMIQRGRDFKINKLFGAQWFNSVPTWMRDSFSEVYAFRHTDSNGLKMLERFGFEQDEIKNLPLHTCLHTGKNGIETIRLVAESSSDVETSNEKSAS